MNDQTSLGGSMGLSDYDRTHRLVISHDYELPFFSRAHGIQRALLSHWFVAGITTFQSGLPFHVTDSLRGSAYGVATPDISTADLTPESTVSGALTSGSIESRIDGYLNPAAFAPAAVVGIDGSTGFGTLGRNVFHGPFQQNWEHVYC